MMNRLATAPPATTRAAGAVNRRIVPRAAVRCLAIAALVLAASAGAAAADAQDDLDAGLAAARRADWEGAIALFSRAIDSGELTPGTQVITYDSRGNANALLGRHDEAIADYTAALKLEPNYANAYNGRGNAYADKGLYDRAIAEYTRVIDLQPDHRNAYYNRGNAYRMKHLLARAVDDYTTAIRLIAHPDHFARRCLAYEALGRKPRAIQDCETALAMNPRDRVAKAALERLAAGD